MADVQITDEQIQEALAKDLQAKAYNEQLLKTLTVEEKYRQFDALVAKLDSSRGVR